MNLAPFTDDVLAAHERRTLAGVVTGVRTLGLAPPRIRDGGLADVFSWLPGPKPADTDARWLWLWWRAVGRRGPGVKQRPTVCATDGCGLAPAPDRSVCWPCSKHGVKTPPTPAELEQRDRPAAHDAFHERLDVVGVGREDDDSGDALDNWIYAHGLTLDGTRMSECDDPFDEVCDRVDRERTERAWRRRHL